MHGIHGTNLEQGGGGGEKGENFLQVNISGYMYIMVISIPKWSYSNLFLYLEDIL